MGPVHEPLTFALPKGRILDQALKNMPGGPVNVADPKIFPPPKSKVLTSMEELIHQFMIVTEGFECPAGEVYHATEVPKGELGFYIISEGGASPYRLRIRSPSFNNLATLPHLVEGGLIADVIANIASLDAPPLTPPDQELIARAQAMTAPLAGPIRQGGAGIDQRFAASRSTWSQTRGTSWNGREASLQGWSRRSRMVAAGSTTAWPWVWPISGSSWPTTCATRTGTWAASGMN